MPLLTLLTPVASSPIATGAGVAGTTEPPLFSEFMAARMADFAARESKSTDSTLAIRDSNGWECFGGYGPDQGLRQHDALREEDQFTRLFGYPALTARGGQCYVSFCRDRYCMC